MPLKFFFFILSLVLVLSCNSKIHNKSEGRIEGAGGTPVNYRLCGDGDTTLLFIHGWCINKEYWDSQFKQFCSRYKVVSIDLPGFGESGRDRIDWSFDKYAEDIHKVITQLKLTNVVLLGHSMSGDIILNVDNKYPGDVIAIVGVDNLQEPGSPMNAADQLQTDSFFYRMTRQFDTTVTRNMKVNLFHQTTDSAIVRRVMNNVYSCDSVIAIAVLKAMTNIWQQEKQLMQNLSHKLFLINSDIHPVNLDSLNKYCRHGAELFTVPATGHYPMIEKPVEFNSALQKLLNSL